jgi:hypothetical protein
MNILTRDVSAKYSGSGGLILCEAQESPLAPVCLERVAGIIAMSLVTGVSRLDTGSFCHSYFAARFVVL